MDLLSLEQLAQNTMESPPVEMPQESIPAEDSLPNLAEIYKDTNGLAQSLLSEIDRDKNAREEFENIIAHGTKALGLKVGQPVSYAFLQKTCNATDNTLLKTALAITSQVLTSLFPLSGPADIRVPDGISDEDFKAIEVRKHYLNYYLTQEDLGYYEDSQRLILNTVLMGTGFRKIYIDPAINKPKARFVDALNIIFDPNYTTILDCPRFTEIQFFSRREVLELQRSGFFITYDLGIADQDIQVSDQVSDAIGEIEGLDLSGTNDSKFKFYEVHVDLPPSQITSDSYNKDTDEIPRPYIITIDVKQRKIVNIRENWDEESPQLRKKNFYVKYTYFPGLRAYGIGLYQLLTNYATTATDLLRLMVDAGTLHTYPGGFTTVRMKGSHNINDVSPTNFVQLDSTDRPMNEVFSPLPFPDLSPIMLQLFQQVREEAEELNVASQFPIEELGANAPVGTALAFLEVHAKKPAAVLAGFHNALTQELRLIDEGLRECLAREGANFSTERGQFYIQESDFQGPRLYIVPVSDPTALTKSHRILIADAVMRLANTAPQLHDMREVFLFMYNAIGVEGIEKLLPPPVLPQSLDPASENMLILQTQPVTVEVSQDDQSHLVVHEQFSDMLAQQQNWAAYAVAILHIQEHKCMMAWKQTELQKAQAQLEHEMQMQIANGMPPEMAQQQIETALQTYEFPPLSEEEKGQLLQAPHIQNLVAQQDAQRQLEAQQAAQEQAAQQIDPNQLTLAEIEQRREAAQLKAQESAAKVEYEKERGQLEHMAELASIAQKKEAAELKAVEAQMKETTELEKAHLQHSAAMDKMEMQRETAMDKNLTDLVINKDRTTSKE